ncbi:MAG: transcriptional regulator GcvA [Pseudomonadota bacterium]
MRRHRLPPLAALRAFEAAARLSSFKAAAEELSVTPAAVSQQVRALEADLELTLFQRGARSVALTAEGERLHRGVSEAFRQLYDAVDEVRPTTAHTLRISCSPSVATKWLVPRLHDFTARFPEARIRVTTTFDLEPFGNAGPDVAIRFGTEPSSDLYVEKLCSEALIPLASPALVQRLGLQRPEDLRRAPLIHDDSLMMRFSGAPGWREWFRAVGLDPREAERGTHYTEFADQAIDAAAAGAGVVLARRFLALADIEAGRLVSPFGPILPLELDYFVVCAPGTERQPLIAAFLEWAGSEGAAADPSTQAD